MAEKVLITGASGMIGNRLTELLLEQGITVNHIGRDKDKTIPEKEGVTTFKWDVAKGKMDEKALVGVTTIIHLAGAGVAEKRWTDDRKKEIIDSRVKSANLIYNTLKKDKHQVKTFISASAVGYYGDCGAEIVTEEHKAGTDFLAGVCKKWEQGAIKMSELDIREVRCRIGIVLAKQGGALPELIKTLPVGVASYFAKNDLYYPWIHIDDVCGIFMHAVQNKKMNGPYNTTAPYPLQIKDLMRHIVAEKKTHALLLPVPPIALKLAMGEMSEMLLGSQNCSDQKILLADYHFKFEQADAALKDIFRKD